MMYYARSTPADLLLVKNLGCRENISFSKYACYFELVSSENSKANLRNA